MVIPPAKFCTTEKAPMPFYFQQPAILNPRTAQQQSVKPSIALPIPTATTLPYKLPIIATNNAMLNTILIAISALIGSLILGETNTILIPPKNSPAPSNRKKRNVRRFSYSSDIRVSKAW
jgi:hypothetical protein